MLSEDVESLIARGEGLNIEFKAEEEKGEQRRVCKSVAAFANASGGTLLYGVSNAGAVLGVGKPQTRRSMIEHWVGSNITPVPVINIADVVVNGLPILVIAVRRGDQPIYVVDGRVYVRTSSCSRVASANEITQRVLSWEIGAKVAELAGRPLPGQAIAAGIQGQGDLATESYVTLCERLRKDFPILKFAPA